MIIQRAAVLFIMLIITFIYPLFVSSSPATAMNLIEEHKLTASDGQFSEDFGRSVAISDDGNTVIIGVPQHRVIATMGAVYIFEKSGTAWSEKIKFESPTRRQSDNFGYSVAASGDGSTLFAVGNGIDRVMLDNDNSGALIVYVRSGDTWVEQQMIQGDIDARISATPKTIATSYDGNTVIVGGTVLVREGTTWTEQKRFSIFTYTDINGDRYTSGSSAAMSYDGNTVIIGTTLALRNEKNSGMAVVFVRNGTTWTEQQELIPVDGWHGDSFGGSVGMSGDGNRAIIGSPWADIPAQSGNNRGAAYIYERTGSNWSFAEKLTASDSVNSDVLGLGVAISRDGKTVSAGSHIIDVGSTADQGAVYLFKERSGTWTEDEKLSASSGDTIGWMSALSGDGSVIITGSPWATVDGEANQGAAYIFAVTPADRTNPVDGASGVPVNTVISANFDRDMNEVTINDTTFSVANGGPVTGSVSYNASTMTATFVPVPDLTYMTDYTASLTGVQDLSGNTIDLSWGFTTIADDIDSDGDGVRDNIDDVPDNNQVASPQTVTGTGKIIVNISGNQGIFLTEVKTVSDLDPDLNQANKPADYEFPHGLVSYKINGIVPPGSPVTVTLTFPSPFQAGAVYYMVDAAGFFEFPGAVFNGSTITLTLVDGGAGDKDNAVNGEILDPGGVAVSVGAETYNSHDMNQDWIIGDFELLDAIDDWALGNLGDFDLLDLIDYWAAGCYHWDDTAARYMAGCL